MRLAIVLIACLCIITSNCSVENAKKLDFEIASLTGYLDSSYVLEPIYAPIVVPTILNVLNYLYIHEDGEPKVTQGEFTQYVQQARLPIMISRMNKVLKNMANTQPQNVNAITVHCFGIMAQIYLRVYQLRTFEDYKSFVIESIPGDYASEYVLPSGGEGDVEMIIGDEGKIVEFRKLIIDNDPLVHIWYLRRALTIMFDLLILDQVDTLTDSDAYKLAANIIFTIDSVLQASTDDNSVLNFYYTYHTAGVETDIELFSTLGDYFPEIISNNIQMYP